MTKTVWITGASSGLGKEITKAAHAAGYHVVMLARNLEAMESIKAECQGPAPINAIHLDLSKPIDMEKRAAELPTPNVLINNAGLGLFELAEHTEADMVQSIMDVNVVGLIAMTKAVIPLMREEGSGHIINIASQAGKVATPKASAYAASKHAVLGFTNSLRMELGEKGIKVSAVNPGPIHTPFFDRADTSGTYVASVGRWMLDAEVVARKVVRLIEKPRRELNLPWWMNVGVKLHQLTPRLFELVAARWMKQK
ncbi:SDR family NAD(P)-dependent oxidoreductase [Shouchella shacheensis]|uniref:SDR family NAD(P)-dependent oxidoreductase n=1 Tax=Shouchella shacheensis TaxID=1649580 RepID=UPI00073FAA5E|nr:SDR family oxidoreductase [Shouchella shacheensis]